jgi:hypothetical protein
MKLVDIKPFKKEGKRIKILVITGHSVLIEGLEIILGNIFTNPSIEFARSIGTALSILAVSSESDFDLILLARSPRFEDEKSKKGTELIPYLQRFRSNACLVFMYSTENGTGEVLLKRREIDENIEFSELGKKLESL